MRRHLSVGRLGGLPPAAFLASGPFLMGTSQPILRVLLPIGLGLLFRLVGLFKDSEGEFLRKFVMRFTVPVFVFFTMYEANPQSVAAVAPMTAALLLMTLALFLIGWGLSAFYRQAPRRAAVHACTTFCNYGWMGFGVASALLGEEGTQRVAYFLILWWPVFYGVGLVIGLLHTRERRGGLHVREALLVSAPSILAIALGLGMNLGGLAVPALASFVLRPFGDMTVPLILLSVGIMLDFSRVGAAIGPALVVSAVTLLIGPLIGWGLAALLARDSASYKVMILEGAMPVATVTPVLGESCPMDGDLANSAIVLSTALSFLTIPLVAHLIL